jgi:hypothetical protein
MVLAVRAMAARPIPRSRHAESIPVRCSSGERWTKRASDWVTGTCVDRAPEATHPCHLTVQRDICHECCDECPPGGHLAGICGGSGPRDVRDLARLGPSASPTPGLRPGRARVSSTRAAPGRRRPGRRSAEDRGVRTNEGTVARTERQAPVRRAERSAIGPGRSQRSGRAPADVATCRHGCEPSGRPLRDEGLWQGPPGRDPRADAVAVFHGPGLPGGTVTPPRTSRRPAASSGPPSGAPRPHRPAPRR